MNDMKLSPQHNKILELHRDMKWHCSTEYEFMRDHRKRISELNEGYLKEKGFELVGIRCTLHNHKGGVFMRRAERVVKLSHDEAKADAPKTNLPNATEEEIQNQIQWFEDLEPQKSR
jgi:hypothetical protein